jgi:hypothetical protein
LPGYYHQATREAYVVPTPNALGLHLCRDLAVEAATGDVTLTGIFRVLQTPLHPATTRPFCAFCALTGPVGRGTLRVAITHLDERDVIYSMAHPIEFRDRSTPVYLTLRLSHCRFPTAGAYEMMVLVDWDVVAQRVFHVVPEDD